jgi:hypothetical protein
MKKYILAPALLSLLALSSCATGLRSPLTGFVYSDILSSESVTSNQAGNRVGEACAQSYFGLVATGDASVETARRNGGITQISSVDGKTESYIVYAKYCVIVRGR